VKTTLFAASLVLLLSAIALSSCTSSVDEKEFTKKYRQLSDRRIQFRLNMKALGDSTKRQRKFTSSAILEAYADTVLESKTDKGYALWNDSLRRRLVESQAYFETQYSSNRPLIRSWERSEMRLDGMVGRIKDGQLSEKEGLDSMNIMLNHLDSLIAESDSLLKISGRRYWDFRRNLEDYRFNARNLKALTENNKKSR